MKSLDLNSSNFLIIVGSFNNEYKLGFNLYQLNPAEKAIVHKNQNIEAINPIHFQFSKTRESSTQPVHQVKMKVKSKRLRLTQ